MVAQEDRVQDFSWRKSRRSDPDSCVEVARSPEYVLVRDSLGSAVAILSFVPAEWRVLCERIRNGEYDLLEASKREM
jgi:hypothetical protein